MSKSTASRSVEIKSVPSPTQGFSTSGRKPTPKKLFPAGLSMIGRSTTKENYKCSSKKHTPKENIHRPNHPNIPKPSHPNHANHPKSSNHQSFKPSQAIPSKPTQNATHMPEAPKRPWQCRKQLMALESHDASAQPDSGGKTLRSSWSMEETNQEDLTNRTNKIFSFIQKGIHQNMRNFQTKRTSPHFNASSCRRGFESFPGEVTLQISPLKLHEKMLCTLERHLFLHMYK